MIETVAFPNPEVGLMVSQSGIPVIVQEQFEFTDIEVLPEVEFKLKSAGMAASADEIPACDILIVCTRPHPLMNKVAFCTSVELFSE